MRSLDLAPWEVAALAGWLMYRLKPEDRQALMRDLPRVYNVLCGYDVVDVKVRAP